MHHYEEKKKHNGADYVFCITSSLKKVQIKPKIYLCSLEFGPQNIQNIEKRKKNGERENTSAWNGSSKLCSNQEHHKCLWWCPFRMIRFYTFISEIAIITSLQKQSTKVTVQIEKYPFTKRGCYTVTKEKSIDTYKCATIMNCEPVRDWWYIICDFRIHIFASRIIRGVIQFSF